VGRENMKYIVFYAIQPEDIDTVFDAWLRVLFSMEVI
jgi:hypothetical protein